MATLADFPADVSLATRRACRKAVSLRRPITPVVLAELGVFTVTGESGRVYQVKPQPAAVGDILTFRCTCTAGEHRTDYPIPCYHAALCARYLCSHFFAAVDADGLFRRTH